MKEFVIDLFCGAGGTSTGVHLSEGNSKVIACVNHDEKALSSHALNHPNARHYREDIRNPEVVFFLFILVNALRKKYPDCIITIWASLECTNFSKAKGGLPRDADSRTLAHSLFMYLEWLNPDYLMIENVIEFMSWGPLDKNGKPVSRREGSDYVKWVNKIKSYGYKFDWKELNSADFGAYTARKRYFAQFAKGKLPIAWPEQTHTKEPVKGGLFGEVLKKWKPVKEVLDFAVEGKSIFNRKKPLVENTLKRIYAGLVKFVANGDDSFIQKHFSGRPWGKVFSIENSAGVVTTVGNQSLTTCNWILKYNSVSKNGTHQPPSVEEPCPTVAAQSRLGVTNVQFIQRYYSGNDMQRNHSVDEPAGVVRTNNCMAMVETEFLQSYYGNGNAHSTLSPCPTLSTKDRFGKIDTVFIDQQYGNSKPSNIYQPLGTITQNPKFAKVKYMMLNYSGGGNIRSIENPAATIVNNDKHNLVEAEHFLFNPQFKNPGNSVHKPCPVIIARQDKKPLSLIICEVGTGFAIPIYKDDSPTMVKIKQFMAYYGIVDIKMRMLLVRELLRIQGFPKDYKLIGNQTDKKKFIGNSVEVKTAKALFESHQDALTEYFEKFKTAA